MLKEVLLDITFATITVRKFSEITVIHNDQYTSHEVALEAVVAHYTPLKVKLLQIVIE